MSGFESKDDKAFEMFGDQWGLVTAGDIGRYNTCTIA